MEPNLVQRLLVKRCRNSNSFGAAKILHIFKIITLKCFVVPKP